MSDTPPSNAPSPSTDDSRGPAPEPFVRGRIVWGRPPETVFRAGPLPRAAEPWPRPAPRPAPAAARPGAGILTGSMIPTRVETSPATPDPIEPLGEPEAATDPSAAEVAVAAPSAPAEERVPDAPPALDPIVEADPGVVEPHPEPEPEPETRPEAVERRAAADRSVNPAAEIIVEPEAPDQVDTVPPPLSTAATAPTDPRAIPSVVVIPALYARVEAAVGKVKSSDRWLIAAAMAAVVVTGGFIWLATLPAGDASSSLADVPATASEERALAPIDAAPVLAEAVPSGPVVGAEAPTRATAPSEPAAVPAQRSPEPSPSVQPQRVPAPSQPDPADVPAIETAPLVIEPPTPAEAPPSDPDAPIETQPQPLD